MLSIASTVFAQTKLYDIVFVKANDIAAYDQYLKENWRGDAPAMGCMEGCRQSTRRFYPYDYLYIWYW